VVAELRAALPSVQHVVMHRNLGLDDVVASSAATVRADGRHRAK
jgi:hypothetical protein